MNEALVKHYFSRLKLTAILTAALLTLGVIVGVFVGQESIGNILLWGSAIAFLFYLGSLQDLARNLGRKHIRWLLLTLMFLPLSFPVSFVIISKAVRDFMRSRSSVPA